MNLFVNKSNKISSKILLVVFTVTLLFSSFVVNAQSDTNTTDTEDSTVVNEAMKSLFSEAKKVAKKDNDNMFSFLMITGVVVVVIIAVWLSFRPDAEDRAREKKKKEKAAAELLANAKNEE